MEIKWSEMSRKQKILMVVYIIFAICTLVLAVLDFAKIWAPADYLWSISLAALCGVACLQKWNENRKAAIVELVCGVFLLVVGVVSICI